MQEGTSIGLFTIVGLVGFGILFGIFLFYLPLLREQYTIILENGVNTPTYTVSGQGG